MRAERCKSTCTLAAVWESHSNQYTVVPLHLTTLPQQFFRLPGKTDWKIAIPLASWKKTDRNCEFLRYPSASFINRYWNYWTDTYLDLDKAIYLE
jgi:hypothetical protein